MILPVSGAEVSDSDSRLALGLEPLDARLEFKKGSAKLGYLLGPARLLGSRQE